MARRVTGLPRLACFISLLIVLLRQVTAAETVKVSTTPVFPAIPWGQENDDFEVLVRVEAPPEASRRSPVDLVAVLDISSSMNSRAEPSDESSRLDLLKRAMKFIIGKLDSGDRLAIVAFNNQVVEEYGTGLVDMSSGGRRDVRRRVDELTARGSTAFRPGLCKAAKILDERSDGRNRAGFILLLSDGKDKSMEVGISAALRKYPVHTFGFSGSHDPNALLSIAQESRGTYSFVNENLAGITGAFAVCLGGLKSVVAVDERISLVAPKHDGVRIKSIQSSGYGSHISGDGASGQIMIGVMYAGEVKNFIVRLHVPSVDVGNGKVAVSSKHQLVLTATRHLHAVSGVGETGDSASLSVQRSKGPLAVQQQVVASALVVNHIVRFRLVEMVAKFVQGLDKVVATIDRVKADELQGRWEEFKEAHKFWGGVELWRFEADIKVMVSGLLHGGGRSGVAYLYSWVSSYQMQRATTMGSTEKVAAEFLTREMGFMLNEAHKTPVWLVEEEDPSVLPSDTTDDETEAPRGCGRRVHGVQHDIIDPRLQMWSKLKREVPLMFRQSADETESRHLTAVFRDASLEAINRAMHHDIYLAVVHERSLRRCYSGNASEQRVEFTSTTDPC